MKKLKKYLFIFLICYFVFLAFMYFYQNHIIYPNLSGSSDIKSARSILPKIKPFYLKITDTSYTKVYYAKDKNHKKTVLFFHGNADNLNTTLSYAKKYYNNGYNIFLCSYPGYEDTPGKTTANLIYKSADKCVKYLTKKQGIKEQNIIVHGHSLGGHTAIYASQNKNFNSIILLAPLGSAEDIGRKNFWFLPVSLLLKDKLISYPFLKNIHAPVIFIHNKFDKVVPYEQTVKMYNLIDNKKKLITLEKKLEFTEHNHLYKHDIFNKIIRWIEGNSN